MGADCIISGVRPQIAQTIVHLGVDLHDIITKSTLADAFAVGAAAPRAEGGTRGASAQSGAAAEVKGHSEPWSAFRFSAWGGFCWSPSRWTCTTVWR